MFPQFFYDYSFYNSSPSQSGCTKFFQTRKSCGRVEEELWKNCRKILRVLDRQRSGEELWKNRPGAKSFYNYSTILPRRAAGRGSAKSFYNFSTIIPRWQFTLVRKQRFYGDFVEKL
jgi:hypothetical protein